MRVFVTIIVVGFTSLFSVHWENGNASKNGKKFYEKISLA